MFLSLLSAVKGRLYPRVFASRARAPAPSFTWNTSTTRAALADSSSRLVYLVYETAFAPRPGRSNFQERASNPGYLKSSTRDAPFDFIESLVNMKGRCETLREFSISASLSQLVESNVEEMTARFAKFPSREKYL